MALDRSIVIVNEYTIKNFSGSGGSRGGTPGAYVTRYMARDLATEQVAPIIKNSAQAYITRYMARDNAVEALVSTPAVDDGSDYVADSYALYDDVESAAGMGGMAFGNNDVSLSDSELHKRADEIQDLFDEGKTVFKTVVSFEHDYLKENGLVPEDLDIKHRGDYRGNLDQLKLRRSIMSGVERMGRMGYDDLRYVGVIQVDTKHVHCHLAMADAGHGTIMPDGTQRGKIPQKMLNHLRRGVDASLDIQQQVRSMSSAVGYERRNVAQYMRKWAYLTMSKESTPQFILSMLPEDKNKWRAGNNSRDMRRANKVVRSLVEDRLQRKDSPLPQVMREINNYANRRGEREGLSTTERQALVDNGYKKVIDGAVNGVYQVLMAVPDKSKSIETPVMTAMGLDLEELQQRYSAKGKKAVESRGGQYAGKESETSDFETFSLRLRSFHARLDHHREKSAEYHMKYTAWKDAWDNGEAEEESRVMGDFYEAEAEYHDKAVSKYQYFLTSTSSNRDFQREWKEVEDYGHKLIGLKALRADKSIPKMSDPTVAEAIGMDVYGQPGGGWLTYSGEEGKKGRARIDSRIEKMTKKYEQMVRDLEASWTDSAAHLVPDTGDDDEVTDERQVQQGQLGRGEEISPAGRFSPQPDTRDHHPTTRKVSDPLEYGGLSLRYGKKVRLRNADKKSDVDEAVRKEEEALRARLREGEEVDITTPGVPMAVLLQPKYPFDECKGVDLHDMQWDWLHDQEVGQRTRDRYVTEAVRRRDTIEAARVWLEDTDQHDVIAEELNEADADISRMEIVVAELKSTGVLNSKLVDSTLNRNRRKAREAIREQQETHDVAEDVAQLDTDRGEVDERSVTAESLGRSKTYPLHMKISDSVNRSIDQAVRDQSRAMLDEGLE